jgi:BirA family transcriptional regulator, biotin operon repressor / biotin---[acetyl-CoA-carboxylase] ligase
MDALDAAALALPGLEARVVERCTSTNDLLLKAAPGNPALLAAEEQTAGRGRRGRRWHSVRGASATFSLARHIRRPAREFPGLSLVAGVAAVRALRALGAVRAALKWPNDLVVDGAKLGGILVETRGSHAVIGIGINCRRAPGISARVRQPMAFLEDFAPQPRNRVIRQVAASLLEALDAFDARGLDALRAEWEALDAYAGRRLRVRLADGRTLSGVASGLAVDGGLRLLTRAGMRAIASGRVVSARAT